MIRILLSTEFVPALSRCRAGLIAALTLATVVSAGFAQSRPARTQASGTYDYNGTWGLSARGFGRRRTGKDRRT